MRKKQGDFLQCAYHAFCDRINNKNQTLPKIEPERCDFIRKVVADKILFFSHKE